LERVGEADRAQVGAARLDAQPDDGAVVDVEAALGDEPAVDDGVEVRVVDDVVDVAVEVVVHPAGGDGQAVRIVALVMRRRARHHQYLSASARSAPASASPASRASAPNVRAASRWRAGTVAASARKTLGTLTMTDSP